MAQASPLGAVVRGLAAGVVGTAAMTAWQQLSMKLQASGQSESEGEQEQQGDEGQGKPWEQASEPAKVARRISEGVFEQKVSADAIPLLTNAMHWAYGTGWGAVFGLIQGTNRGGRCATERCSARVYGRRPTQSWCPWACMSPRGSTRPSSWRWTSRIT